MPTHSVSLGVTPCIRFECKFWLEDDGWNAQCDDFDFTIQAATFGQAKSDMEVALGKGVKSRLPEIAKHDRKHAA